MTTCLLLMAWDPALLRKYNTTNHFRLLNQVRSELKEQPIQRPLVTSRAAAASAGGGRRSSRAADVVTTSASVSPRRRGGSSTTRNTPAPLPEQHDQPIFAVPVLTDVVMPDSHTGA